MAGYNNIEHAGLSDIGMRRSSNQDDWCPLPATDDEQWRERGHVFVVADGMGAHAVGEMASKIAADTIPHIYSKHAHEGPIGAIRRAFLEANTTIHTKGQANRDFEGMGTTASALLIRPEGAWISHVGDSRIYRVRDGKMEQLSFDHSLVWEMARRQRRKPEEMTGIPNNVIVRSLGPEPLVEVDVEGPHSVEAGDIFVLCSDGLSGPLSDCEIGAVVNMLPPEQACQTLVDLANLHGGPDNITVIVVRVLEDIGGDESSIDLDPLLHGRRPGHERFPWPMISLGAGILLAVAAILLTVNNISGSMFAFLLAAAALVVGLVGIVLQHRKEEATPAKQGPKPSPPNVYRKCSCTVKSALIEKIMTGCGKVEERIQENKWDADWDGYNRHRRAVSALRQRKQLVDAFRESCSALGVLSKTTQKHRPKNKK